jgi:RNA ligase (TIGR02306 family)
MSEFYTQVVQIEDVRNHPNGDNLDICTVLGNYPVITKRDEYKVGNKAVYLSIDSLLPLNDERWSFLRKGEYQDKYHKLKAAKIRQIFSMGILTPANPEWEVGLNVQELLGIKKYEPEMKFHLQSEAEENPGFIPAYTDIDGYRKFSNLFQEDEYIVILEKLHGGNARYCFSQGRLWVGSHHQIKKDLPGCVWWEVIRQEGYFKSNEEMNPFGMWEDHIFMGEVLGIQDLKYGLKPGKLSLRIFDIYDIKQQKYLNWDMVQLICNTAALPTVPVLYEGPWKKELTNLAEGNSTIPGANHVREGIVIKPVVEQVDYRGQRKILKLHGEGYLLRKEK